VSLRFLGEPRQPLLEVSGPFFRHITGLLGRIRPAAKACNYTGQQRKTATNIHALSGIRTHDPSIQAAKTHALDRVALLKKTLSTTVVLEFDIRTRDFQNMKGLTITSRYSVRSINLSQNIKCRTICRQNKTVLNKISPGLPRATLGTRESTAKKWSSIITRNSVQIRLWQKMRGKIC
jgi:hypothetical protein